MTDQPKCTCPSTWAGLNACSTCPTPWPDTDGATRIAPRFTAQPVSPEEERAATERAVQAAANSKQAAAWIAAHSTPTTDPELRQQLADAITALGKSETELAALRAVARGYCPHCGRGDAAPTVADWEQQKQRADRAEAEIAACRRQQWPRQLAHAEAAIEHVRAECDAIDRDRARLDNESFGDGYADAAARIRIALDQPAPAATQTTDGREQRDA